jgi:hypothetical protein
MIDEGMRRRRKVLGWVLLGLALVVLVGFAVSGRVLLEQVMLGTVRDSYALLLGVLVIFLALAGAGAYLLRTVRGR